MKTTLVFISPLVYYLNLQRKVLGIQQLNLNWGHLPTINLSLYFFHRIASSCEKTSIKQFMRFWRKNKADFLCHIMQMSHLVFDTSQLLEEGLGKLYRLSFQGSHCSSQADSSGKMQCCRIGVGELANEWQALPSRPGDSEIVWRGQPRSVLEIAIDRRLGSRYQVPRERFSLQVCSQCYVSE